MSLCPSEAGIEKVQHKHSQFIKIMISVFLFIDYIKNCKRQLEKTCQMNRLRRRGGMTECMTSGNGFTMNSTSLHWAV